MGSPDMLGNCAPVIRVTIQMTWSAQPMELILLDRLTANRVLWKMDTISGSATLVTMSPDVSQPTTAPDARPLLLSPFSSPLSPDCLCSKLSFANSKVETNVYFSNSIGF